MVLIRESDKNRQKFHEAMRFKRNKKDISIRFYEKFDWKDECWIWKNPKSFEFWAGTTIGRMSPRRFSYEFFKGKIPSTRIVITTCDNRYCVQPKHLYLSSRQEIIKKLQVNNLRTHCPRCNSVYIEGKTKRRCPICHIINVKRWEKENPIKLKEVWKRSRDKKRKSAGIIPMRKDGKCRKCLTVYTLCADGRYRCKKCQKIRHAGYYLRKIK